MRELLVALRQCRLVEVGAALPALVRDLHTSIATGRDVAELLDLAVLLHTQGSHSWLRVIGAEVEVLAAYSHSAQAADLRICHTVALTGSVCSRD